jgi:hypothetical protein
MRTFQDLALAKRFENALLDLTWRKLAYIKDSKYIHLRQHHQMLFLLDDLEVIELSGSAKRQRREKSITLIGSEWPELFLGALEQIFCAFIHDIQTWIFESIKTQKMATRLQVPFSAEHQLSSRADV